MLIGHTVQKACFTFHIHVDQCNLKKSFFTRLFLDNFYSELDVEHIPQ
jgi:hypothetical protein